MADCTRSPFVSVLFFLALGLFALPGHGMAFQGSVVDDVGTFENGYIEVVGESESGQRRYAAIRAATVVAQRAMLEELKGIRVQGESTIADGMLQSDLVKSQVSGVLRGARVCGRTYHAREQYAEVCLRLYLRGRGGVYDSLYKTLETERVIPEATPVQVVTAKAAAEPKTKVVEDADFDGVIIEMAGLPFKPAIVNRIMNPDGQVLFEPSKVVNAILVERGTGGFTNQLGKAKGLLASWNGLRPLLLQAVSTKQGTDAVISKDDAARLLASDQKNSFLSQARVVFVIN